MEYFDQLLNCEDPPETFTWISSDPNDSECPPPSRIEVVNQLNRLKNNKTPGEDGIQGEILKNLDEVAINKIHDIIENLWSEEQLPKDWGTALICPIFKKGDPQKCSNYRGIALLDTAYNVLSYCLLDRVVPKAENIIGDYQGGFRTNRSTTDQMFILRQIIQKHLEFDKEVHVLFVDFRKAYDSIHRESFLNILKDFKFPRKIINLIGASLKHTDIQVKIGNVTSQPTRVTTGLRQGDALSQLLFNLVLERVIREMNISDGVILGQTRIGILAYADDIALLGEDLDMIKKLGSNLINTAKKVGLTVNEEKTEYLVASRGNRNGGLEQYIKIEELKFKRVSQFKYLGSMITEDNDIKTEVSTRIQLANRGFYGLEKVLKLKALSKALKIKMYMTLLRPIVLYGSETWALRKTEESRLMIFERKVLRKIFGPIYDRQTREWRKLHNVELQGLFQRPNIVREITKRKLSWAGHAWRKQGTLVKWVIEEEPNGKRPIGRPKLRWEDGVKKEVEKIEPGVKWREVAEDRDRWQNLVFSGWS